MSAKNFMVWRTGLLTDGVCKLASLENVADTFELLYGESRATGWPDDASTTMDAAFPKDLGLADSLFGTSFLTLSARARAHLDGEKLRSVEWLPVNVKNHKGRLVPAKHYILNPLAFVDCIDIDASEATFDAINPSEIDGCEHLVLRENVIPPDLGVFRLSNWRQIVIVRRAIADRMLAAGLTGLELYEAAEYNGLT